MKSIKCMRMLCIESFNKEYGLTNSLKTTLEFWKDKFLRVMSLIKDKLFGK